jgi:hypothetical protein
LRITTHQREKSTKSKVYARKTCVEVNNELYFLDDEVHLMNERIEELDEERRRLLSLLPHE